MQSSLIFLIGATFAVAVQAQAKETTFVDPTIVRHDPSPLSSTAAPTRTLEPATQLPPWSESTGDAIDDQINNNQTTSNVLQPKNAQKSTKQESKCTKIQPPPAAHGCYWIPRWEDEDDDLLQEERAAKVRERGGPCLRHYETNCMFDEPTDCGSVPELNEAELNEKAAGSAVRQCIPISVHDDKGCVIGFDCHREKTVFPMSNSPGKTFHIPGQTMLENRLMVPNSDRDRNGNVEQPENQEQEEESQAETTTQTSLPENTETVDPEQLEVKISNNDELGRQISELKRLQLQNQAEIPPPTETLENRKIQVLASPSGAGSLPTSNESVVNPKSLVKFSTILHGNESSAVVTEIRSARPTKNLSPIQANMLHSMQLQKKLGPVPLLFPGATDLSASTAELNVVKKKGCVNIKAPKYKPFDGCKWDPVLDSHGCIVNFQCVSPPLTVPVAQSVRHLQASFVRTPVTFIVNDGQKNRIRPVKKLSPSMSPNIVISNFPQPTIIKVVRPPPVTQPLRLVDVARPKDSIRGVKSLQALVGLVREPPLATIASRRRMRPISPPTKPAVIGPIIKSPPLAVMRPPVAVARPPPVQSLPTIRIKSPVILNPKPWPRRQFELSPLKMPTVLPIAKPAPPPPGLDATSLIPPAAAVAGPLLAGNTLPISACPPPPIRPAANEECRWRPIVDPAGCLIDFKCEERPARPVVCPPAPAKPNKKAAPNCNWIAVLDADNCILEYECEPKAPEKCEAPPLAPDDNDRCKWIAMKDHKGCVTHYECTPPGPAPPRFGLPRFSAPIAAPISAGFGGFRRFAGFGGFRQAALADSNNFCCYWALAGECQSNPNYMLGTCARSCRAGHSALISSCPFNVNPYGFGRK